MYASLPGITLPAQRHPTVTGRFGRKIEFTHHIARKPDRIVYPATVRIESHMTPEFVGLTDIDDPHAISRSRIESVESQFKRLVVINSGLRQPCTRHGLAVESEMGASQSLSSSWRQTAMGRFEMRGVSLPCGIYTGHPFRREIAQNCSKSRLRRDRCGRPTP